MIVDDRLSEIKVIDFFLKRENIDTDCYTDPLIALEALNTERHDILLMDINMPLLSGFEFAKKLETELRINNLPIIFISALDKNKMISEGFNVGGVDYIQKPIVYSELISKIKNWVKTKNQLLQLESNTNEKSTLLESKQSTAAALKQYSHSRDNVSDHMDTATDYQTLSKISESLHITLDVLQQKNLSSKTCSQLIDMIQNDFTGSFLNQLDEFKLTISEKKIALLIKAGESTENISKILFLSPETIKSYRKSIRKKMDLSQKNIQLNNFL